MQDYRLPQRFQYRKDGNGQWENGVCIPVVSGNHHYWRIWAGQGFSLFDDDPWEEMGLVLGDVSGFRWLDNDYGWSPQGGSCCGFPYETSEGLLNHLRSAHIGR